MANPALLHTASWRDVTPVLAGAFLRQYNCRDAQNADDTPMMGLEGISAETMNRTPIPTFMAALCATGLPFRVNVLIGTEFMVDGAVRQGHFSIPPYTI